MAPILPSQPAFQPTRIFTQLLQLSPTRYVQLGFGGWYQAAGFPPNLGFTKGHLLFFNAAGDTLSNRVLNEVFPEITITQEGVVSAAGDGSFLCTNYDQDSVGWSMVFLHFDSLGTLNWQRRVRTTGFLPLFGAGLATPDGYLLPCTLINENTLGGLNDGRSGIVKIDLRGRVEWQFRHPTYSFFGRFTPYAEYNVNVNIAACQDGSYAFTYQDLDRYPLPNNSLFDRDNHLMRFTAGGDTLASVRFGAPDWQDIGFYTTPTADGGFLVSGSRRYRFPLGGWRPPQGYVFKLDSTLAVRWEKRFPRPDYSSAGSEIIHAQELANGHVRVIGYTSVGPPTQDRPHALVAEVAPPPGTGAPGDTATVVAEWRHPLVWPDVARPDTSGSAVVAGGDIVTAFAANTSEHRYRARWSGLGRPAPYDLCARPPRLAAQAAGFSGPGGPGGNEFTFTLAQAGVQAGPRYGVVSLVRWTYSDGAPADTGWTVTRTFATPVPVEVTCTVFNNLGCTVSTRLYPLGACPCPTGVAPAPAVVAVEVYPNPAPGGRFTLHAPAGAHLTVTDALGRVVLTQVAVAGRAVVDLSAQAAGIYALRLTWPDGRTATRRLVK